MSDITLAISAPQHATALTGPIALRGTATGNTAGLFFKWFSSLNPDATAAAPELNTADHSLAILGGTLSALNQFGTHTVVLAATDQDGVDLASIQQVRRAALAGGKAPASPTPCVVDQLANFSLRTPAADNAPLSKLNPVIEFLAPGPWAKQDPLTTGPWVANIDYQSINNVAIRLSLAPTNGATAANSTDIPLDLGALQFFRAVNTTWLSYTTPLPTNLGNGPHRLTLTASGGSGAGAGSLSVSRLVTLS
jgi:hypothetical protein